MHDDNRGLTLRPSIRRRAFTLVVLLAIAATSLVDAPRALALDNDGGNAFDSLINDIVTYAPPVYVTPFTATTERARSYFFGTETVRPDPSKAETQLDVLRRQINAVTGTSGLTIDKARLLLDDVVNLVDLLPRLRITCFPFGFISLSAENVASGATIVVSLNRVPSFIGFGTVDLQATTIDGQLALQPLGGTAGQPVPIKFPLPVNVLISPGGTVDGGTVDFIVKSLATVPCGATFVLHGF
jgi:hypothetical protein